MCSYKIEKREKSITKDECERILDLVRIPRILKSISCISTDMVSYSIIFIQDIDTLNRNRISQDNGVIDTSNNLHKTLKKKTVPSSL